MMKSVQIRRNTNGDSRVADHIPTISEFNDSNSMHCQDVKELGQLFCYILKEKIQNHDWTKIREPYRSMFYQDLVSTIQGRMKFEDGEWARIHYTELERHHLGKFVPDDVDLFDVIEMLCDCVAAGMARGGGKIYGVKISGDVLEKAVANTVEILKSNCEILEG